MGGDDLGIRNRRLGGRGRGKAVNASDVRTVFASDGERYGDERDFNPGPTKPATYSISSSPRLLSPSKVFIAEKRRSLSTSHGHG
jgi:hypothetical protein